MWQAVCRSLNGAYVQVGVEGTDSIGRPQCNVPAADARSFSFSWSPSTLFSVSPLPAGRWSCRFQIQFQVGQGRVQQRIERESGGRWFGATRVWLLGRVRAGATREAAVADESMGRFLGSGSPSLLHTMSFSSDFDFVFLRSSMPCAGARVCGCKLRMGNGCGWLLCSWTSNVCVRPVVGQWWWLMSRGAVGAVQERLGLAAGTDGSVWWQSSLMWVGAVVGAGKL
ncbi:hypothetical protein CKAH01_11952 [Colletotrichum kahawae]|uniref:Uncharacterized protein n=1 Tax=Colletotrichum kahawae TaxID=34407 RepID=A0AAD9YSN3_COLKA|nr:hypothetical protein CKAH01_11952 [Colletotrichum kahawae]